MNKFKHRCLSRACLLAVAGVVAVCAVSPSVSGAAVPANGRAWELVTSAKPNSAKVLSVLPLGADDGRVLFESIGPFPGAVSGSFFSTNLALRGGGGWGSTPIGIPYTFDSPEVTEQLDPLAAVGFSDDDSTSIWVSSTPLLPGAPPEGHVGLYRRAPDNTLSFTADLGEQLIIALENYIDLSNDGAHTVFTDGEHLLPSDTGRTEGESIYDSTEAGLQQVDVTSGGALLSSCGSALSSASGTSESGQRIFFSNPAPSTSCPEPSRLYLREGGNTVEVSASQCTRLDCNEAAEIEPAAITPSGSSVFMTTPQQLTNEDTDETRDLYRYQVGSGVLSLVSDSPPEAEGEVDEGIVNPSSDGSRVYFCARGRLTVGEGSETEENLYLADEGGLHFVRSIPCPEEIQLARDGRSALLTTTAALAIEDTDESSDVYLYDADSNAMTLLSTGPSGGDGAFEATIDSPLRGTFRLGRTQLFRAITENAKEAFFTTEEQLVPEDANNVADVYEWTEGHIGLVSSGTGEYGAQFGSVSPDGRTVLFKTTATLLPADVDGGDGDLYVARQGGGFPEAEPRSECAGASCAVAPRQRIDRPPLPSSVPRRQGKGKIRLLGVSQGDNPTLKVSVPQAGLVSAKGKARLGGRVRTVARGSAGAIRSGKVLIPLHLSAAVRHALARGASFQVHMVVREDDLRLSRTIDLGRGGSK